MTYTSKAQLSYKTGNIFDYVKQLERDKSVYVPHVCNNIGGWGSGFVVALSNYNKKPEQFYRKLYENEHTPQFLGRSQFVRVGNVTFANMIAQNFTISKDNPRPLNYAALAICMNTVKDAMLAEGANEVWCPKFGSALAGGDWKFIELLIQDCWVFKGIDVTVFELEK